MIKILVFGGLGQVGLALRDVKTDYPALAVTSLSRLEGDVTSLSSVWHAIKKYRPDCVVNAAGWTAVDAAEADPEGAFAANEKGPQNITTVCAELNIPMIHISTDYIFDGLKNAPYTEDDAPNPLSVYGRSKLAGDLAVQKTWKKHIIIRSGWIFSRSGKSFLSKIMTLCRERDELGIVADQTGCPTPASALARVLLNACEHAVKPDFIQWGVYHFSGKDSMTWYEFACAITEKMKKGGEKKLAVIRPITTRDYPLPARRPAYSVLDCERIKNLWKVECPELDHFLGEYIA